MNNGNTFIISWDMTGLEAVVDVTQDLLDSAQWEKDVLFDVIKDPDGERQNEYARKLTNIIQMMTLRARANAIIVVLNDELYAGQLKAATYIEEHFGVEE